MFELERKQPAVTLSYRLQLHHAILERRDEIDALELTVDHYFWGSPRQRQMIREAAAAIPMVAHGVGLSLGTDTDVDAGYLSQVAAVIDELGIPYYSEHLAFTGVPGCELSNLLPGPRTDAFADRVLRNIEAVKAAVPVPFLLENITRYFDWPDAEYEEAEFLADICRRSGSGILLDVENACVNAANGGTDAARFVDALPADLVWAVHTAGGGEMDGFRVDTHDEPLRADTLDLLDHALDRLTPGWIVLERDRHLEDEDGLIADLARLRDCAERPRAARSDTFVPATPARPVRRVAVARRNLPLGRRQDALIGYLTGPAVLSGSGDPADSAPELAGLDAERLRLMAKMSRGKRIEKIRSVLPATFDCLRPGLHDILDAFAAAVPPDSSRRIDNARQFRDFLSSAAAGGDAPAWAVDVADYEIALSELLTQDRTPEADAPSGGAPAFCLRSGVRLLDLAHDIRTLLEADAPAETPAPPARRTCLALVVPSVPGPPRTFELPASVFDAIGSSDTRLPGDASAPPAITDDLMQELASLEILEVAA